MRFSGSRTCTAHSNSNASASRYPLVGRNGVGDLIADGADRIERRARILEDHRHRGAMQIAEITPPRYPRDVSRRTRRERLEMNSASTVAISPARVNHPEA